MKKIAVVTNHTKDVGLHVTRKLVTALNGKAAVYMSDFYANSGLGVHFAGSELYENADFVIVLGGDGTILRAAEPCGKLKIPIMGINLGRVGFMAEIEADEIETAVDRLLAGDYMLEERMMMRVNVRKAEETNAVYFALNDVVISKPDAQMLSLELYREAEKINAYMADGVVVATPTGSTGYSLSAGGPVADPTMELFIATPLCAHMLSSRAAILPADRKILVKRLDNGNDKAVVTIDGQIKEHISRGEYIEIRKAEERVLLIKMGTQSFYDVLTHKLS